MGLIAFIYSHLFKRKYFENQNSHLEDDTGTANSFAILVCSKTKMDVVFLLDVSSTIGERNFITLLNAVKRFITNSAVDSGNARIGVVTHSSRVYIKLHLNEYSSKSDHIKAIDEIPYIRGVRNTADGIKILREESFSAKNGDRSSVPNYAIIITDGVSERNRFEAVVEAEMSREVGIHLFVIGIGVKETEVINEIAGLKDNLFLIDNFEDVSYASGRVQDIICSGNYLVLKI